jgi:hypothetical protein
MDQNRDLGLREHPDRLTARHDRSDAAPAMRGNDDKIATFRSGDIDDRLVGLLVLDQERVASDAGRLGSLTNGAEGSRSMVSHTHLVLGRRVLDHLRVGSEDVKRRQDGQRGELGADFRSQRDTVADSLPSEFRSVRRVGECACTSWSPLVARSAGQGTREPILEP